MNYNDFPDLYGAKHAAIRCLLHSSIIKYLKADVWAHWPKLYNYVEAKCIDPTTVGIGEILGFFFHKGAIRHWSAQWEKIKAPETEFRIVVRFEFQRGIKKGWMAFAIRLDESDLTYKKWVVA